MRKVDIEHVTDAFNQMCYIINKGKKKVENTCCETHSLQQIFSKEMQF